MVAPGLAKFYCCQLIIPIRLKTFGSCHLANMKIQHTELFSILCNVEVVFMIWNGENKSWNGLANKLCQVDLGYTSIYFYHYCTHTHYYTHGPLILHSIAHVCGPQSSHYNGARLYIVISVNYIIETTSVRQLMNKLNFLLYTDRA